MKPYVAAIAMSMVVGSETVAATAALQGILLWNRPELLMDLLWISVVASVLSAAITARWVFRWEVRHEQAALAVSV